MYVARYVYTWMSSFGDSVLPCVPFTQYGPSDLQPVASLISLQEVALNDDNLLNIIMTFNFTNRVHAE